MLKSLFLRTSGFMIALVLLCTATASLPAQSLTLDQILSRMDTAGQSLRSMSARIEQKKWTEILQEFDAGEAGVFLFLKDQGKVYMRREIQQPQATSLVIRDGTVLFYQPRIKQAQKYELGKNKDKAEFLLLGFGADKDAMSQAYQIRLQGQEILEGLNTYVLELTPRSEKVSAFFNRIVLWIDPERWIPVQQKLVELTGDFMLIRFEDIEENPALSKSRFDLNLPRDVKVVGGN